MFFKSHYNNNYNKRNKKTNDKKDYDIHSKVEKNISYLLVDPGMKGEWDNEYANFLFFQTHIESLQSFLGDSFEFPKMEVFENDFKVFKKSLTFFHKKHNIIISKRTTFDSLFCAYILMLERDNQLSRFLDLHEKCLVFKHKKNELDITPLNLLQNCLDLKNVQKVCVDDDDDEDDLQLQPLSFAYLQSEESISTFLEHRKQCLLKSGFFSSAFVEMIHHMEIRWISTKQEKTDLEKCKPQWNAEFMGIRHLYLFFQFFRNKDNEIPSSPLMLRDILRRVLRMIFSNYK